MGSEIAKNVSQTGTLVAVVQQDDDKMFGEMSSTGNWLPRIQLFGSNTKEVTEGKIGVAHYGITVNKDTLIDLGKEVDCLPVAWRPKAMELSDPIVTSHDPASKVFDRIKAMSDVKDSGCMFGPEFLIWIPGERMWVTFFLNNKTARRAAGGIKSRLGKGCTMRPELIKTTKYTWHGPSFSDCSTPFDLPDEESVAEETTKFLNPPAAPVLEEAPAASTRPR